MIENQEEQEERARFERLRADLEAFERWNFLPRWKRDWFGEKTREDLENLDKLIKLADDIPEIKKAVKLAKGAETASKFWRNGFLAFCGGVLLIGPTLKLIFEGIGMLQSALRRFMGAP